MAKTGNGTILQRKDSSGTYKDLAEIVDIQPPQISRESVETTVHGAADDYRTFIPGLKDGGEVTVTVQYDGSDSTHEQLVTDAEDQTVHEYKVKFPSGIGKEWEYKAFITALGDETPLEDRVVRNVTYKVSGKPTLSDSA